MLKKTNKIKYLAILIFLLILGSLYFYLRKDRVISPTTSSGICQQCSGPWDTSCPGNTSCFKDFCLPVLKMGQGYTREQIDSVCQINK